MIDFESIASSDWVYQSEDLGAVLWNGECPRRESNPHCIDFKSIASYLLRYSDESGNTQN